MFYPDIWNEFIAREYCHGAHQREYPDWHRQRERYYVWALDADSSVVHERIRKYQEKLSAFLVGNYCRQPHITLAISGFLTNKPIHNDDVTQLVVDRQQYHLHSLNIRPFTLTAGTINSFSSAPFIEVCDKHQSLDIIRHALALDHNDFRVTPYVPHITVGVYSADYAVETITKVIGTSELESVEIAVDRIVLYSYSAKDIGSPLQEERVVWL